MTHDKTREQIDEERLMSMRFLVPVNWIYDFQNGDSVKVLLRKIENCKTISEDPQPPAQKEEPKGTPDYEAGWKAATKVVKLQAAKILEQDAEISRLKSQPEEPKEGDDCKLSDEDLITNIDDWVSRLCRTGGKAWCLEVPVNMEKDPDILIVTLINRFKSLKSKIASFKEKIPEGVWRNVEKIHELQAEIATLKAETFSREDESGILEKPCNIKGESKAEEKWNEWLKTMHPSWNRKMNKDMFLAGYYSWDNNTGWQGEGEELKKAALYLFEKHNKDIDESSLIGERLINGFLNDLVSLTNYWNITPKSQFHPAPIRSDEQTVPIADLKSQIATLKAAEIFSREDMEGFGKYLRKAEWQDHEGKFRHQKTMFIKGDYTGLLNDYIKQKQL